MHSCTLLSLYHWARLQVRSEVSWVSRAHFPATAEGALGVASNSAASGFAGPMGAGGVPVLSKDAHGAVYSLRGCPYLAVKEIRLDGLDQHGVDAIRRRLTALLGTLHPDVLKYHQVLQTATRSLLSQTAAAGT